MTEYIDKAEVLEFLEGYSLGHALMFGDRHGEVDFLAKKINEIFHSDSDVAPVIHARWHYTGAYPHRVYCPNCNREFLPNMEWIGIYDIPTNYCPCCGAKMDESENET